MMRVRWPGRTGNPASCDGPWQVMMLAFAPLAVTMMKTPLLGRCRRTHGVDQAGACRDGERS